MDPISKLRRNKIERELTKLKRISKQGIIKNPPRPKYFKELGGEGLLKYFVIICGPEILSFSNNKCSRKKASNYFAGFLERVKFFYSWFIVSLVHASKVLLIEPYSATTTATSSGILRPKINIDKSQDTRMSVVAT